MHAANPNRQAVSRPRKATKTSRSGEQHGSKSRRVIEAINGGFNTLRLIAEFTQIDYRTANSLVFSLEQQGRVIANSDAVPRRERRFHLANPVDPRSMPEQSKAAEPQAHDFGLFGIGFLMGGMPPQVVVQSTRKISYT